MEAGADLQQAADPALDLDLATGGGGDPRQDLEQGAVAGAVAADDAEDFALAPGAAADEAEAVVIGRGFRFGGRRTWGGIRGQREASTRDFMPHLSWMIPRYRQSRSVRLVLSMQLNSQR